jgi:DNA-binding NarL/FixJ family response regulator
MAVQINLRIPEDDRDLMQRVAARLRHDPAFRGQLDQFLRDLDDDTITPTLADRVARLEARIIEVLGDTPPDTPKDTPFATGQGRARRLTPAGEVEVNRRIIDGQSDADIAAALGVSPNAVKNRRQSIGKGA